MTTTEAPPVIDLRSARVYRGDCGAVVVVADPCPDGGGPIVCSCGAEVVALPAPAQ